MRTLELRTLVANGCLIAGLLAEPLPADGRSSVVRADTLRAAPEDTNCEGPGFLDALWLKRLDCNGNNVDDHDEILYHGARDSNGNGLLDDCESPAVGIGVPLHGQLDGPTTFMVQRTSAGTYLFSLRVAHPDTSLNARIDIIDPSGRHRSTILDRAIRIDTTAAWRPPKRWPDGSRFQRGFYDILATRGRELFKATVFLERSR